MKTSYSVVGAMAGSSMDGLDLAYVRLVLNQNRWSYELGDCQTIIYPKSLYFQLKESANLNTKEKEKISINFGHWISEKINEFKSDSSVDLIAVHGHTTLHDPENEISEQLGDGATIASVSNIPTVTEFRSLDVTLGGQGAPLVPYGDFELFDEYDACLNLGGIANVSLKKKRMAWDICPCNQVLNYFAEKLGKPYDKDGRLASTGNFDKAFHDDVLSLDFFQRSAPKSLPNAYIKKETLDKFNPVDGLQTYTKIVADLIAKSLYEEAQTNAKILVTGGGAFNSYLIYEIRKRLNRWNLSVPNEKLISFKEALIFAFLGLKRVRNEINVLASVTGASKDTCSGVIHLPK